MADNYLNIRVSHMHDIEEIWNKCPNFIPSVGEIIIYDVDTSHEYPRVKVGDGVTSVTALPFLVESAIEQIFNSDNSTTGYVDGGRVTDY